MLSVIIALEGLAQALGYDVARADMAWASKNGHTVIAKALEEGLIGEAEARRLGHELRQAIHAVGCCEKWPGPGVGRFTKRRVHKTRRQRVRQLCRALAAGLDEETLDILEGDIVGNVHAESEANWKTW